MSSSPVAMASMRVVVQHQPVEQGAAGARPSCAASMSRRVGGEDVGARRRGSRRRLRVSARFFASVPALRQHAGRCARGVAQVHHGAVDFVVVAVEVGDGHGPHSLTRVSGTVAGDDEVVAVDHLVAATVAEKLLDFTAFVARDAARVGVGVGHQAARHLASAGGRAPPPRRRARSGPRPPVTPAGSRLLPDRSAASAPSSTVSVPAGLSDAGDPVLARRARARLRQEPGLARAPCRGRAGHAALRPSAIAMRQPAPMATRAAASLVTMPPDE